MDMETLKSLQGMSVMEKLIITEARITEAINIFGADKLYISLSGGKDSTVLHHIVLKVEQKLFGKMVIPRVYCNTGLEYPEVTQVVKDIQKEFGEEIIQIITPKMGMNGVIKKYGYPMISKEQSAFIHEYKRSKSEKHRNTRWNGNRWGRGKISEKWKFVVDADFEVSHKCCDVMKKSPFKKYEKETGRIPVLGKMACESSRRTQDYIRQGGCIAFDTIRKKVEPMGFWLEKDVLEIIHYSEEIFGYKIKIATVYGDILENVSNGELFLTGVTRTGCIGCGYGVHMEKGENRYLKLKKTHPKQYDFIMRGGEHDEDGVWKPKNGLGFDKVLTDLSIVH